jgi:hypothetical protein
MSRIDQASELCKMMAPPLVRLPYCGAVGSDPGFQLATPPAPHAIQRVHAIGHLDARINERDSGHTVFLIQLESCAHNASEYGTFFSVAEPKIIIGLIDQVGPKVHRASAFGRLRLLSRPVRR